MEYEGAPVIRVNSGIHDGTIQGHVCQRARPGHTQDGGPNGGEGPNADPGDAPEQGGGINHNGATPLVPVAAQLWRVREVRRGGDGGGKVVGIVVVDREVMEVVWAQ